MESHGSFHGIYSWKLQFMEAMEDSISTDTGIFHVLLWKLPPTSMEVGSRPASMHLAPASMEATNYFHLLPSTSVGRTWGSLHGGSSSLGSGLGLGLDLWKQLAVCHIRGSRWKYVGVHGSSWKLPRYIFVEAAIDGSNRSFQFHRLSKLSCTSMEASTNFHGSK